jgi:acetyl-CoA carboxylase carboxyltransferase component
MPRNDGGGYATPWVKLGSENKNMSWEKEVGEIERRKGLARQMGGAEGIERQHKRGKLTVRERIDRLVDKGSWNEFLTLTGTGRYDGTDLTGFTPKPSVDGEAKIDGRKVIVTGGDFTVRGGSAGSRGGMGQELSASQRALEWRLPYVRLLDAAGGSVRTFEEHGRTYLPDGNAWTTYDVQLLSSAPVVSAVLGSVAGLPAINACLSHFSLMVRDISQLFPGGPPVVKAALGYDITKEDLGGEQIHVRQSGSIDNLAENEDDAFEQIRKFLSYLPTSVHEMAPRGPIGDHPQRADDELL